MISSWQYSWQTMSFLALTIRVMSEKRPPGYRMWLVHKLSGIKIMHDTQCTGRENNNMKMLDHEVKQTAKQCNQIHNSQETDNMSNSHSCQSLATSSVMTEKISTFNRCFKLAISYEVCVRFIDDTTSSVIERISTFNSCCKIAFCLRFVSSLWIF